MSENALQSTITGKFDLIIEKMENLNEKYAIHAISDVEHFVEIRKSLEKLEERLDKVLFADETGLVLKIDRLEQNEQKRGWLAKTAFGGVLASIGAHIWGLIKA